MENRNIKFAKYLGYINLKMKIGEWFLDNPNDETINFSNDWNKIHELKEWIENKYPVLVHFMGKSCFITTTNPELMEANYFNDCLASIELSEEYLKKITAIEYANIVLEQFIDKIDDLIIFMK